MKSTQLHKFGALGRSPKPPVQFTSIKKGYFPTNVGTDFERLVPSINLWMPKVALFLNIILLFMGQYVIGQGHLYMEEESLAISTKKLHRKSGHWMFQTEESFGLVSEINFLPSPSIGLGISRGSFEYGEGAISGKGINLGFTYTPIERFSLGYVSAWYSVNAFLFFGFYGGIKAGLASKANQHLGFLRPEIGFGMAKLNVFYGYQFLLEKNNLSQNPISLNISYYLTIFPKKQKS